MPQEKRVSTKWEAKGSWRRGATQHAATTFYYFAALQRLSFIRLMHANCTLRITSSSSTYWRGSKCGWAQLLPANCSSATADKHWTESPLHFTSKKWKKRFKLRDILCVKGNKKGPQVISSLRTLAFIDITLKKIVSKYPINTIFDFLWLSIIAPMVSLNIPPHVCVVVVKKKGI